MQHWSFRNILCSIMIVWLATAIAPAPAAAATERPRAVQGVMDMSGVDWEQAGLLNLDGEWEFVWGQLLTPDAWSHGGKPSLSGYFEVPRIWNNVRAGTMELSNYGYATYRLVVKLAPSDREKQYAVYMPSVATAYKLWINGKLSATNGTVGRTRGEMRPANYPKVVVFEPAGQDIELVIQVSNFVQRKGGLWESIILGTSEAVLFEREKRIMLQVFAIGSLAIMGAYHIVLYWLRRKDKSPLIFGALCFAVAMRTFVLGETLLVRLVPGLDWETVVKVEYVTTIMALPLFIRFCYEQYGYRLSGKLSVLSFVIGGAFSVLVLVSPARVYTYVMPYYLIFVVLAFAYLVAANLGAWIRKREGALLNFIALLLFAATVMNDILYYNFIIHTREMISIGLLLFLFAQSVNLSVKFTRSFAQNEHLSGQLLRLNERLEEKVKERTQALEQSVHEMNLMEQSRRTLLSNVSHELRTPLTSIQGYAQALLDGVVKTNHADYIRLILDKSQLLDRIFKDLLELSKLEARKIDFRFQHISAGRLVRDLFGQFQREGESKGIRIELEEIREQPGYEAVVNVDPVRIKQVFGNLIANAVKFTPPGGSIRIRLDVPPAWKEEPHVVVQVSDTGCGVLKEDIPYLFDRFYRGKQARNAHTGGAGLGLAIAKEIMDLHEGRIGVESEPNAGSTFYFTLPVRFIAIEEKYGVSEEDGSHVE